MAGKHLAWMIGVMTTLFKNSKSELDFSEIDEITEFYSEKAELSAEFVFSDPSRR